MTATLQTPTAAPLRNVVSPAPPIAAPIVPPIPSTADLAAAIAASPDPAAELVLLVHAVAAQSATAAVQGAILHTIKSEADKTLKSVRMALLDSIRDAANPHGRPGVYAGFTVTLSSPPQRISYSALKSEHPDVYDEMVTVGEPSLRVEYTG